MRAEGEPGYLKGDGGVGSFRLEMRKKHNFPSGDFKNFIRSQ